MNYDFAHNWVFFWGSPKISTEVSVEWHYHLEAWLEKNYFQTHSCYWQNLSLWLYNCGHVAPFGWLRSAAFISFVMSHHRRAHCHLYCVLLVRSKSQVLWTLKDGDDIRVWRKGVAGIRCHLIIFGNTTFEIFFATREPYSIHLIEKLKFTELWFTWSHKTT